MKEAKMHGNQNTLLILAIIAFGDSILYKTDFTSSPIMFVDCIPENYFEHVDYSEHTLGQLNIVMVQAYCLGLVAIASLDVLAHSGRTQQCRVIGIFNRKFVF